MMAGVEVEARKLPRPEPEARTWPRQVPAMPYFQIKAFPRSLHDRLRVLAVLLHKPLSEVATMAIESGIDVIDRGAADP